MRAVALFWWTFKTSIHKISRISIFTLFFGRWIIETGSRTLFQVGIGNLLVRTITSILQFDWFVTTIVFRIRWNTSIFFLTLVLFVNRSVQSWTCLCHCLHPSILLISTILTRLRNCTCRTGVWISSILSIRVFHGSCLTYLVISHICIHKSRWKKEIKSKHCLRSSWCKCWVSYDTFSRRLIFTKTSNHTWLCGWALFCVTGIAPIC